VAPLRQQPGFAFQIGGFDRRDRQSARILAAWDSRSAYERFMADSHDGLFRVTGQAGSFHSPHVRTGELVLEMPGQKGDLIGALTAARLLRVADCMLAPGRAAHFEEVQERIWAPAMARADGMLGGVFTRLRDDHSDARYLVATGWRDQDAHDAYQREQVPALAREAGNASDLADLRGYAVDLVPEWTIRRVR
jgi:heme-degrading monooxygenase HmoA